MAWSGVLSESPRAGARRSRIYVISLESELTRRSLTESRWQPCCNLAASRCGLAASARTVARRSFFAPETLPREPFFENRSRQGRVSHSMNSRRFFQRLQIWLPQTKSYLLGSRGHDLHVQLFQIIGKLFE